MKKYALIVVIVAAAAALWWYWRGGNGSEQRYVTAAITRGDVTQAVSATGTISPVKVVNVGTQVSGVVRDIKVDFNDRVEKGQVLAELDKSLLDAQLQQSKGSLANAEAALRLASANFSRNEGLFAKEYISRAEMDLARQQLEAAKAQVATAKGQVQRDTVNLGYSVITSPVSGVIISRDVDVGQTVAANFQTPTLFKIAEDLAKMQIDTSFSEADIGEITQGQRARFTVDAFSGKTFEGAVRQVRLNPSSVQNVVTYNVVVDFSNEDFSLLPGMTAFVTIDLKKSEAVLRMPNSVFGFRPPSPESAKGGVVAASSPPASPNSKRVFVLDKGVPVSRQVTIGITDGRFTEVKDGLAEGELLVVQDNEALKAKSNQSSRSPLSPGGNMKM